ncbi:MAG: ACT domain-containing protein [Actinobacteria bacterium]|nr:ACT domain-containing protein [Actinomycetota bacterium]
MTRYAYLGPIGTFTEAALRTVATSSDSLIPFANVTAALDAVRSGGADRAKNYPNAEIIVTSSTAAAAASLSKGEYDAAIAAPNAAETYGLEALAKNIGDNDGAVTRFVLVGKPGVVPPRTGHDRTSLAAFIGADHAGALLEVLTEFAVRGVNLTFIQSRPTGRELGHYHFIIDAEGHISEERVGDALTGLRRICEDVRYLGSYPRADKVPPTTTKATTDESFSAADNWLAQVRAGKKI